MNNDPKYLFSSLNHKLRTEEKEYILSLLSQPPEYILSHAHEFVIREKIVSCIGLNILTMNQIQALLRVKKPLKRIYEYISCQEMIAVDDLMYEILNVADYFANAPAIKCAVRMRDVC